MRAVGTSLVGVLLGLHLAELGFDAADIGVVSSAGLAGALTALPGWSAGGGLRATLALYPALLATTIPLYLGLSPEAESPSPRRRWLSPGSRRVVAKISALFALDGIGGGFLVSSLVAYFFVQRFDASAAAVAALFFAARVANVGSHFGAAWLPRRVGLVNTMVFTHIPSSLLLAAVAFTDSWPVAATLFLLRECLVEMDVPTRQSYVVAVVAPEERTTASGATNVVRLASWAIAPLFAGAMMERLSLAAPLLVGAAIKIVYDLLLFAAFRRVRPPEESASPPVSP